MQNQEFLAKLTVARQAQTLALQRFAHAQERLAQLEARQQALHARLHASAPVPDPLESNPNLAFLPENGDLEALEHFVPLPQTDHEITERIVTRPAEASQ